MYFIKLIVHRGLIKVEIRIGKRDALPILVAGSRKGQNVIAQRCVLIYKYLPLCMGK